MMKTLAFLLALPLAAAAQATKEDIKKLVGAGVSEDVVVTFIRAHGQPRMSADDLVELKQAGAGEKILTALAGSPVPAPVPASRIEVVEKVVERPVYVPSPTYVYSTPSVSSSWCGSHYGYDACGFSYARPVISYTSSWYPRSYYSSWYGSRNYYGGYGGYRSYSSCRPRVGISVGWRW